MYDYPYQQTHIRNIEYDNPQTRGYGRNSQACPVQWCLSIIVSTSRVALLFFNEIGHDVQVTLPTWEKKQVVTVFTCQYIGSILRITSDGLLNFFNMVGKLFTSGC